MRVSVEILTGSSSGKVYAFEDKASIKIGREPGSDVCLPPEEERAVSAKHARLTVLGGHVTIEDVGSTNGTFIDGERISGPVQLGQSQEVTLGKKGPRLRVSVGVPRTVLEMSGTIAEIVQTERAKAAEHSGSGPQTPEVGVNTGSSLQTRPPVGRTMVMQMIDSAMETRRQSDRLSRPTIFAQEIVRMAVKESGRRLKRTMLALLLLLVAAFGVVFYRIASVRSEVRLLRTDIETGLQKGWQGVESRLSQHQVDLESQRKLYETASQELRKDLDRALGAVERNDRQILALRADLEASRNRHSDLIRQREEAVLLQADATSAGFEPPDPALSARVQELDSAVRSEQQKQTDILAVLAEAATLTSGGSKAGTAVKSIGAQLLVADASAAQMESRLESLAKDLGVAAGEKAQRNSAVVSSGGAGDAEAILDAITRIEVASAPKPVAALVPASVAGTALVAQPATAQVQYSKPYLRANLKKRLAIGKFECLVAQNPWNLPPSDVGRQMRAQMTTLLNDTGVFSIVEREDLGEVLDEQQLGQTGTVTEQTGATSGKLLGAQAILVGKVTQIDQRIVAKKSSVNWGGLLNSVASIAGATMPGSDFASISSGLANDPNLGTLQTSSENQTSTFTIHIDFKVLDTETGEVLFTTQGHGVATSSSHARAVGTSLMNGGYVTAGTDSGADATRLALYDATVKIMEEMNQLPWRGRIMDHNGDRIIINGGSDAGLREGDTFQVLSRGKELIDQESGLARGHIQVPAGTVRIALVSGSNSEADVIDQTVAFKPGDDLLYLGVTRPLRAGEDSASADSEKAPVKYGLINSPTAYSGPGDSFATVKLTELEAGSPVRIKLALGDWAKVVLPSGAHAWMRKQNLSMKEEAPNEVKQITVSARKAVVRSVPSTRGKKVDALREGDVAAVADRLGRWYLVTSAKGTKGWLNEGDLRPTAPTEAIPARTS